MDSSRFFFSTLFSSLNCENQKCLVRLHNFRDPFASPYKPLIIWKSRFQKTTGKWSKKESKKRNEIIIIRILFKILVVTEHNSFSIGSVSKVVFVDHNFQIFKRFVIWLIFRPFCWSFFCLKFIQDPGKSWKYGKSKITDTTPKLKKTGPEMVQNCPKPWKMDDFRQNW